MSHYLNEHQPEFADLVQKQILVDSKDQLSYHKAQILCRTHVM